MPQGSHRLPAAWLEMRNKWIDDEGKPLKPEIAEAMETSAELLKQAEAEYSHFEGWHYHAAWDVQRKESLEEAHASMEFEAVEDNAVGTLASHMEWLPPRFRRALKGMTPE